MRVRPSMPAMLASAGRPPLGSLFWTEFLKERNAARAWEDAAVSVLKILAEVDGSPECARCCELLANTLAAVEVL